MATTEKTHTASIRQEQSPFVSNCLRGADLINISCTRTKFSKVILPTSTARSIDRTALYLYPVSTSTARSLYLCSCNNGNRNALLQYKKALMNANCLEMHCLNIKKL